MNTKALQTTQHAMRLKMTNSFHLQTSGSLYFRYESAVFNGEQEK